MVDLYRAARRNPRGDRAVQPSRLRGRLDRPRSSTSCARSSATTHRVLRQPRHARSGRACRRRSRCTAGPTTCPTSRSSRRPRRRSRRSSSSPTAYKIPIVPRAGGTGLADGAVPLRGGILVDFKLMNQIHEIDLVDRTVTVGPGINMLKLNEELRAARRLLSRRPRELPVQPRRRPDRHRRLVAAGRALRPHARQRDLDAGRPPDRRDRRDRRGRRPQAAALAPASTSSSCSPATRARSASRPRRRSSSCRAPRSSSPRSSPSTTT